MWILSHLCLCLSSILLFLLLVVPATSNTDALAYNAVDFILLSCGSPSYRVIDQNNRSWETDYPSRYAPTNVNVSMSYTAESMEQDTPDVPYQTARLFVSQSSTYSFPVSQPAQYIIRLHFYPNNYSYLQTSQSYFSVTANGFTLLSNFSAFLYSMDQRKPVIMKEFIVYVTGTVRRLDLTFSPNPNSFAFINGIEIISLPDHLYYPDVLFQSVERSDLVADFALETLYRLNVGGEDVEIQDDSGPVRGMFRYWSQDDPYISGVNFSYPSSYENHTIQYTDQTPPYSAPEIVYRTSRVLENTSLGMGWALPFDSGFHYILRLHFCEFQLEVTKPNERAFIIAVNDETVEPRADIISWTGGTEIPTFKNYLVRAPDDGRPGLQYLHLSIFQNVEGSSKRHTALLNGIEVFKLSDSTRSLATANSHLVPSESHVSNFRRARLVIFTVIGSVIGLVILITMPSFIIFGRRRKARKSTTGKILAGTLPTTFIPKTRNSNSHVSLLSDLCRNFSLDEIQMATANFDENLVIGRGGFGNVYKGYINDGATTVAVKRLRSSSNQGALEFRTEIELLSRLRHLHLVSLIGYCDEKGEMILVYDYMPHGTLRDHLYNSENHPLLWKHRLQICLGAAKGLDYLHTSTKHAIIHRDVKSTNILLDEKWVAKVSDFGLSKIGPSDAAHTHITTSVKGSFGYLDPEYYKRHQLTDKSDVYSFGVVLFEVLCGRPAILPCSQSQEPDEQVNLADWANYCYEKATIDQIVDPNLDKDQIAPECLDKFVETAITCLRGRRIERPAMSDVVRSLEHAMQLQEAAEGGSGTADGGGNLRSATSAFELGGGVYPSKNSDVKYVEAFSDLVNPAGR